MSDEHHIRADEDIVPHLRLEKRLLTWRAADKIERLTSERDALRAQLDEAGKALEPFAAAEVYCGSQNTDPDDEVVKWLFAIGHIRRARFVLKMIKGGGDE